MILLGGAIIPGLEERGFEVTVPENTTYRYARTELLKGFDTYEIVMAEALLVAWSN